MILILEIIIKSKVESFKYNVSSLIWYFSVNERFLYNKLISFSSKISFNSEFVSEFVSVSEFIVLGINTLPVISVSIDSVSVSVDSVFVSVYIFVWKFNKSFKILLIILIFSKSFNSLYWYKFKSFIVIFLFPV